MIDLTAANVGPTYVVASLEIPELRHLMDVRAGCLNQNTGDVVLVASLQGRSEGLEKVSMVARQTFTR